MRYTTERTVTRPRNQFNAVKGALPGFAADIAHRLNMTTAAVCRNLRALERENLAHIDVYPEKGIRKAAHWAVGPAPEDAPEPPDKRTRDQWPSTIAHKMRHLDQTWRKTELEDATIAQARAAGPATWLTALELPDVA